MDEAIPIIVSTDTITKSVFATGGLASIADVPIGKLKSNLADIVAKLGMITADLESPASKYSLTELEVGLEISAEGGVSLIGTAKAGATASVKLTFSVGK
jgi:hypothetical protein